MKVLQIKKKPNRSLTHKC